MKQNGSNDIGKDSRIQGDFKGKMGRGWGGGQLFEDQLLFKKMRYINTFYLFWYLKLPVDAALYSNLFR